MSATGRRIACLLVPDLVVAAELRAHPELAGRPLVVASGSEGRAEIIATSTEAKQLGVQPGQTLAHARAVSNELEVCTASPALESSARESLLDIALSFSPRATAAPPAPPPFSTEAAVFLDAAGMQTLFRSEAGFAGALGARAASLGLSGVVVIAGSCFSAHVVARRLLMDGDPSAVRVLPQGAEASFLGALPVDLLAPDDALAQRLTRFGVRTVRDLLALPRRALSGRLGPEALQLAARARGEDVEAPLPEARVGRSEEAVDLDYAIERAEPLLFVLRGALSRLFERLTVRSLAARALDLELQLEGGGRDARRVGVGAPTLDLRVWLRLLALELETRPPPAAVESLRLGCEGCPGRRDQLDLFLPLGPSPGALDRTLAELEALCGSEHVGAPQVADSHRPDDYQLGPFRLPSARQGERRFAMTASDATPGGPERTTRRDDGRTARSFAVRALRPPVPAQVCVECGVPASLRSAVANGRIVHVSGPWRSTGRWWSEADRYALDHFDVQVSDGAVARLCFDWIARRWHVDALYD